MSIWYILECSTVRDVGDMAVFGVPGESAEEDGSRSDWVDGGFLGAGPEGAARGAQEAHLAAGRAAGLVLSAAVPDVERVPDAVAVGV